MEEDYEFIVNEDELNDTTLLIDLFENTDEEGSPSSSDD